MFEGMTQADWMDEIEAQVQAHGFDKLEFYTENGRVVERALSIVNVSLIDGKIVVIFNAYDE